MTRLKAKLFAMFAFLLPIFVIILMFVHLLVVKVWFNAVPLV